MGVEVIFRLKNCAIFNAWISASVKFIKEFEPGNPREELNKLVKGWVCVARSEEKKKETLHVLKTPLLNLHSTSTQRLASLLLRYLTILQLL